MTLPSIDATDRLVDPAFAPNEWVRLSDYTQLLNMLIAIDAWFTAAHNASTGAHNLTYGIGDFTGDADTATVSVQSGTVTIGSSAGDVNWSAPTWPAQQHGFGNLTRMAAASGIVELLPALQGSDFSTGSWQTGVIGCVGTRQLTSGSGSAAFVCYHAPTWSPEVISPVTAEAIGIPIGAAPTGPYTVPFEQRSARQRFTSRDVYNGVYGRSVPRSMYRQLWRLGVNLYNSILFEHNATGVSIPPSLMRLFGRSLMPSADVSNVIGSGIESFMASNLIKIGAHNNTFQYPLPYLRLCRGVGSPTADWRWLCLPAFDDTAAYLDIQPMGSALNPSTAWQWAVEACMVGDVLPSVGTLPALNMTALATQGHKIRNIEWLTIYQGMQRYKELFQQGHDFPTGGHRYPLPALKNAVKVFDSAISAPAAVANVTYTPSSRSVGSSNASSYTDVTTTVVDTLRSGGDVYFGSMKGNPGSGIATMSFGNDGTHVYSIVRRKTSGSTNTFAQRVWRVDH